MREDLVANTSERDTYKERYLKLQPNLTREIQSHPLEELKSMYQSLGEHFKKRTSEVLVDLSKSEILQMIWEKISLADFLMVTEGKKRGKLLQIRKGDVESKESVGKYCL